MSETQDSNNEDFDKNIMDNRMLTTNRKALTINMDSSKYGTLAEIGAGQEVVRYFFMAGGAAGTVAKSMSAYDMKFSDEIYGKSERYVSRDRLNSMLKHEYDLLVERLSENRGDKSTFFVFADTVAAKSYQGNNECHGWMGVRFQSKPLEEPNDILIHVRMLDKNNRHQQEALGVIGVNLIYGAFYYSDDPEKFIISLVDSLTTKQIEVDMIEFIGPRFKHIDNRLLSLLLVENGLTNAVMYSKDGKVLQPSEVLYKKAILVERGSFRPFTYVNKDMLECAGAQFLQEENVSGAMVLLEMTINNLKDHGEGKIDRQDFLDRVNEITTLGYTILVSNYFEYYRLISYFRRYTHRMIGLVLGINNLHDIFNEEYYSHLDGGILEAFGRLFKEEVKLYIYPMSGEGYYRYLSEMGYNSVRKESRAGFSSQIVFTARNLQVTPNLRNLYDYLLENHFLESVVGFNRDYLEIFSRDCLIKIGDGDPTWEDMVPPKIAEVIKSHKLWGYKPEEKVTKKIAKTKKKTTKKK